MSAPAPPTWSAGQPTSGPASPGPARGAHPTSRRRHRVDGIDMARALAILGMAMVHFGPFEPDTGDLLGQVYRASYGRASVLFVLLAGVGVSLLFRGRRPLDAWQRIGWRVVVFFPLGVALQALPTPVAVILHFYALYYLLGGVVALLPTRWLAVLTVVWTVAAPIAFIAFLDPDLAGRGTAADLGDPILVVRDLLLTGYYPLVTWAPPLLVGILVGRADLRDTTTSAALALAGAIAAVVAYGGSEIARELADPTLAGSPYLLAEGHTGAPLNVLGATGVAVAVLGVCLLLAAALPRVCWPLTAVGQMALTVYVVHLLVLAVAPQWLEGRADVIDAFGKVGRFYLITMLLCVAWRWRVSRGPLESLIAVPFTTQTTRRMRQERAATASEQAARTISEANGWESQDRRQW